MKYDLGEDEWLPKNPNRGQPSNIWKDICSVGNSSNGMGDLLAKECQILGSQMDWGGTSQKPIFKTL